MPYWDQMLDLENSCLGCGENAICENGQEAQECVLEPVFPNCVGNHCDDFDAIKPFNVNPLQIGPKIHTVSQGTATDSDVLHVFLPGTG